MTKGEAGKKINPERIVRVFPRRTSMTPKDDYAFIGEPSMFIPDTIEIHISCAFTWDIPKAQRLAEAWGQHYIVRMGGPAFDSFANGFTPGIYVRHGITFTSRGCNYQCPWCLVHQREGKLREIEIHPGNIIQDNNLLQCSKEHINKVIDMLRHQSGICLSGGLDARLLTDSIADDLRSLRIKQLFFSCDTKEAIKSLERAKRHLDGFRRDQLRCYVLAAFSNETISEVEERLEAVWDLGFLPFVQLYQSPDKYIHYSNDWRALARRWSRPAITKALHDENITRKDSGQIGGLVTCKYYGKGQLRTWGRLGGRPGRRPMTKSGSNSFPGKIIIARR
jgi:hypothetical protein